MQTRCPTCLRVETRANGVTTVLDHGGLRRPAEPDGLAAWRIIRVTLEGGPTVTACCDACTMPMVSEDGPSISWTIDLPSGGITVADGAIVGPSGSLSTDAAETLITQALVQKQSLALSLYQGAMFSWLIVPFMIWLAAMMCFSLFLCIGVPHGAAFMTR